MAASTGTTDEWAQPGDPESLIELTALLDEGSSGAVFQGVFGGGASAGAGALAVKVVSLEDPDVREEVVREIGYLRKTAVCPNLLGFCGAWLKENHAWIAMELCELGSIIDAVQISQTTLNADQVKAVAAAVASALAFCHELNIAHRDVKGKNILLTADGKVKLCDFGVAIDVPPETGQLVGSDQAAGSPHWMDPVVAGGGPTTLKCDVWSLGITVLELMEGEPPHADVEPLSVLKVIASSPAPTFTSKEKSRPKHLLHFVTSCLSKDLKDRPSAGKLMHHPFIEAEVLRLKTSGGKPCASMARYAKEALPAILAFREFEAQERARASMDAQAEAEAQAAAQAAAAAAALSRVSLRRPKSKAYDFKRASKQLDDRRVQSVKVQALRSSVKVSKSSS